MYRRTGRLTPIRESAGRRLRTLISVGVWVAAATSGACVPAVDSTEPGVVKSASGVGRSFFGELTGAPGTPTVANVNQHVDPRSFFSWHLSLVASGVPDPDESKDYIRYRGIDGAADECVFKQSTVRYGSHIKSQRTFGNTRCLSLRAEYDAEIQESQLVRAVLKSHTTVGVESSFRGWNVQFFYDGEGRFERQNQNAIGVAMGTANAEFEYSGPGTPEQTLTRRWHEWTTKVNGAEQKSCDEIRFDRKNIPLVVTVRGVPGACTSGAWARETKLVYENGPDGPRRLSSVVTDDFQTDYTYDANGRLTRGLSKLRRSPPVSAMGHGSFTISYEGQVATLAIDRNSDGVVDIEKTVRFDEKGRVRSTESVATNLELAPPMPNEPQHKIQVSTETYTYDVDTVNIVDRQRSTKPSSAVVCSDPATCIARGP